MSRACLGQATSTTTQGLGENKYPGDSNKVLVALKLSANVFEHSNKVILEAGGLVSRLNCERKAIKPLSTTPLQSYIPSNIKSSQYSPDQATSSIMQFLTITFALTATTLASPLTRTRRNPVPDPIPNAGSFTSWSCFDCADSNPCLSFPHDNIVSDTCYPLEQGQASLQVLDVALPGCVCKSSLFL
jgi:hypothetical protein